MSDLPANMPAFPREIEVLTFMLRDVRMGVDTEQISGMLEIGEAESMGLKTVELHERLSFSGGPVPYKAPRVLLVRDAGDPYGIVIDQPEDICAVKTEAICPLPSLVTAAGRSRAIWGVVIKDGNMILLVDLYKLDLSTHAASATNA